MRGIMMGGMMATYLCHVAFELELQLHERNGGRPALCAGWFFGKDTQTLQSRATFFMTWHVLPSIGLIVIGVAGMGALQMGVHKLFHGKVLPLSRSRLCPRAACPFNCLHSRVRLRKRHTRLMTSTASRDRWNF